MKRIISLTLTAIMLLTNVLFFSACDNKDSEKTIAMFNENKANFVLIRDKEANSDIVDTVSNVPQKIGNTKDDHEAPASANIGKQQHGEDRAEHTAH